MALICMSLTAKDVDRRFGCLFASCISAMMKCLHKEDTQ